jgi:bifunctional UDP-N-acetylglucosamine pyrophosphorylase/glucosamine-1-phosphate N-acetyltransferase
MSEVAIVVLAAGKGSRMKSAMPKVMHRVAGRSLLGHVLHAARPLGVAEAVIVVGPEMDEVAVEARTVFPGARTAVQRERLGTAHAVSTARDLLSGFKGTVLVLYGDGPLISSETLNSLVRMAGAGPVVLGFEAKDPTGYGRLLLDDGGHVVDIREELDASPAERMIRLSNSGVIALSAPLLWQLLPGIGNSNAKGEYYLTDIVALAASSGTPFQLAICDEGEVSGVNDRVQLAAVEAALQDRYRRHHMLSGVTMTAPETVYFSADTEIGQDVSIGPHVVFGPGVRIETGAEILAFSHIEGAQIAAGARIGPYARLRPGTQIGVNAHVGNFVEMKQATLGNGAKANHLSYIGDAAVGARANVGAGTITCNYDGFEKHRTDIGADVFIGSNTALVAPVKVGDGASVAAGSVVTRDVPEGALAISRPALELRLGWAQRIRQIRMSRKSAMKKG